MKVKCPVCGRAGTVPENLLGRRLRCSHCGKSFVATATQAPPQETETQRPAAAVKPQSLPEEATGTGTFGLAPEADAPVDLIGRKDLAQDLLDAAPDPETGLRVRKPR